MPWLQSDATSWRDCAALCCKLMCSQQRLPVISKAGMAQSRQRLTITRLLHVKVMDLSRAIEICHAIRCSRDVNFGHKHLLVTYMLRRIVCRNCEVLGDPEASPSRWQKAARRPYAYYGVSRGAAVAREACLACAT